MPPSGVVTGFRREVACNVSKTKNRIAPRNVALTQNAKSRLRPLGGLRPALRPPSGINAGIVKRRQCWTRQAGTSFLPPFTGEGARRVEGRIKSLGDVNAGFAKRRRCWVLPLPLLLLRRCRQCLYIFLSAIALPCYFKSCQAASMQGSSSGVVTGVRRDVACNVSKTKNRIAPRNVVLTQNAKSRQRPLGGLKPALRPPSGINTGVAKRKLFPSPVYGGRCPKGGRGR